MPVSAASPAWLKWFPSDWRADPALRTCSLGARGLWIELLGYMHEATPYGHLLVNGKPLSEAQIAVLVGAEPRHVRAHLRELREAGVPSFTDDGVMYSRRMVRDLEKRERDVLNGRRGGNPTVNRGVNPPHNPSVNGEVKAQKPEARSHIPEQEVERAAVPFPKTLTRSTWADWKSHLAAKGKGMTPQAEALQLHRLGEHADPERVVQDCIANGWVTLPPVGGHESQKPRAPSVHDQRRATAAAIYGAVDGQPSEPRDITGESHRVA